MGGGASRATHARHGTSVCVLSRVLVGEDVRVHLPLMGSLPRRGRMAYKEERLGDDGMRGLVRDACPSATGAKGLRCLLWQVPYPPGESGQGNMAGKRGPRSS